MPIADLDSRAQAVVLAAWKELLPPAGERERLALLLEARIPRYPPCLLSSAFDRTPSADRQAPPAQERLGQAVALLSRAKSGLRAARAAGALTVLHQYRRKLLGTPWPL
jgi:hypothetical protein